MYILEEDYEHLDRLFNSLDNSRAHDFMDLLLRECSKKTGNNEWEIIVRNANEIADRGVPEDHIITREMVYAVYRAVTGGIEYEEE